MQGYTCGPDGVCDPCGGFEDPCCDGGRCDGWLACAEGACGNPFASDPSTDVAICRQARLGGNKVSQRDWCYWYAAFYKADTALCESIEWEDMKEKCTRGADPVDYYLLHTFG
jgi:hypothetical protein